MLWLLTPGNFVLWHVFFFFPKALSKHRMGLAPGIVDVSSLEINGMGFAEPALDIDKVCSCWGICWLCFCQRPASATAKGKDALSRLKTLAYPSCKQQWSWPLVLAQAGAPCLLLHSPAISLVLGCSASLNKTHPQGSEVLHFLWLWVSSVSCIILDSDVWLIFVWFKLVCRIMK